MRNMQLKKSLMVAIASLAITLTINIQNASAVDSTHRSQTGAYNTPYRMDVNPDGSVKFLRNGSTSGVTQPSVLKTSSEAALTTLNGIVYSVIREKDTNKIYCNRYAPSSNAWLGWRDLTGATLDAPTISSDGGNIGVAVHGTDDQLYAGIATDCNPVTWHRLAGPILGAPQADADKFGFYVYYSEADGTIRRFSSSDWEHHRVHGFPKDQDAHSINVKLLQGANTYDFGFDNGNQFILNNWAQTGNFNQTNAQCNFPSMPGFNFGAENSPNPGEYRAACFSVEDATGDTIANFRARINTDSTAGFTLRTCTFGHWKNDSDRIEDCDFGIDPAYFPSLSKSKSINFRAREAVFATDAQMEQCGSSTFATHLFFLVDKEAPASVPTYSRIMNMVLLSHANNRDSRAPSSFLQQESTDGPTPNNSSLGQIFTVADVGGKMLRTGADSYQEYNLDLKPWLTNWVQSNDPDSMMAQWKLQAGNNGCNEANNWCGIPLPSQNPDRWIVVNFLGVGTQVYTGGCDIRQTRWLDWAVDDVVFEVLWD